MKRKLIAGILAAALIASAVSCGDVPQETSASSDSLNTTVASSTESTSASSTSETTAGTTETTKGEDPVVTPSSTDIEAVSVGQYITLRYNGASAEITWEVKKGVGSRETVTFTAKPREDYLFDGWSTGNAIVNGASVVSEELTYSVTVSEKTELFFNTSMQLYYHENGGTLLQGGNTDSFSAVFHHNPNTRPEMGYFEREGYVLTGYSTEADGSGEVVSLGSKVTGGKGRIDLYCIWEKTTPETEFETQARGVNLYISAYTGNADTVVVPPEIGGKKVVGIAKNAFAYSNVKRVVLPSSIKEIENLAFDACDSLETLVLFDTVTSIGKFEVSDALKNIRINSTTTLIDDWYSSAAAKIDRLMWAEDKKKIIIIGGSGSFYGFDSAVLDEALGYEYEIINFGENANISSIVYFDIVEDFVGEGDIVLWCPEPGTYTLGDPRCSSRFWEFRKSNYDFTKYINPQYYENLFSSFASFCSGLRGSKFKSYDKLSASINKYGDDMSAREWNGSLYDYNFNYGMAGKTAIAELVANMIEKGAAVYFSFAAMQESGMEGTSEAAVRAYEALVTSIPGIVSISDYKDCIYQDDYFWNSAWHMTDEGAKARSAQVAKDILKALLQ